MSNDNVIVDQIHRRSDPGRARTDPRVPHPAEVAVRPRALDPPERNGLVPLQRRRSRRSRTRTAKRDRYPHALRGGEVETAATLQAYLDRSTVVGS